MTTQQWAYIAILALQLGAVVSIARTLWLVTRDHRELREERRAAFDAMHDEKIESGVRAEIVAKMTANAMVTAAANTITLAVFCGLWLLLLLVDVTFTIAKLCLHS